MTQNTLRICTCQIKLILSLVFLMISKLFRTVLCWTTNIVVHPGKFWDNVKLRLKTRPITERSNLHQSSYRTIKSH
jgi:hypothetical protein